MAFSRFLRGSETLLATKMDNSREVATQMTVIKITSSSKDDIIWVRVMASAVCKACALV